MSGVYPVVDNGGTVLGFLVTVTWRPGMQRRSSGPQAVACLLWRIAAVLRVGCFSTGLRQQGHLRKMFALLSSSFLVTRNRWAMTIRTECLKGSKGNALVRSNAVPVQ